MAQNRKNAILNHFGASFTQELLCPKMKMMHLYVANPWNLRPSRKKGDQNRFKRTKLDIFCFLAFFLYIFSKNPYKIGGKGPAAGKPC